jgi:hypothetical protein
VGTINALFANIGKRAWYLNPGRFLKLNIKVMKKFIGLGRSLSKNEQKNIYGGYIADVTLEEDQFVANCSVYCSCNSHCAVNATCVKVTSCSATDQVGVTCGSTYYSCATICSMGCN